MSEGIVTCRKNRTIFYRFFTLFAVVFAIALSALALPFALGEKASAEDASTFNHTGATELSTAFSELPSGSYYMTDDIVLPSSVDIGSSSTVNFCLHGHTLTATNRYAFEIYYGSTLNLYDCGGVDHTEGKITVKGIRVWGGTFNMYGGTIRDVDSNYGSGGGVVIANSGVCLL